MLPACFKAILSFLLKGVEPGNFQAAIQLSDKYLQSPGITHHIHMKNDVKRKQQHNLADGGCFKILLFHMSGKVGMENLRETDFSGFHS